MDNVDGVDDVIAIAEHEWRAMGITGRDRASLAADLRHELTAAAADGITPRQLLGTDVRAFARTVAIEAGTDRTPHEYTRLLQVALTGAGPGLFIGWVFWWLLPNMGVTSMIALYGIAPITIVVGAIVAVRVKMADVAAITRTSWAMAVLLPLTGIVITPVTIGFAYLAGFSTSLPVLLIEVALVAATLAGAVVLARRWALAPALAATEPVHH